MAVIKRQSPSGYVLFCDDVRQEITGKLIYIGVYLGNEMTVFANSWPVTIPKFSLVIACHMDRETSLSISEVRVYLPGEPEDAPSIRIPSPPKEALAEAMPAPLFDDDNDLMRGFITHYVFSPLVIQQEGRIRVIAYFGDDSLKLGSLCIKRLPVPEQMKPPTM